MIFLRRIDAFVGDYLEVFARWWQIKTALTNYFFSMLSILMAVISIKLVSSFMLPDFNIVAIIVYTIAALGIITIDSREKKTLERVKNGIINPNKTKQICVIARCSMFIPIIFNFLLFLFSFHLLFFFLLLYSLSIFLVFYFETCDPLIFLEKEEENTSEE